MSEQKNCQPQNSEAPKQAEKPQFNASGSKYLRDIRCLVGGKADVYAVLDAFNVTCPARQHAIKKLLCSGIRGKGDVMQDLQEARDAIDRAIQMEAGRESDNTINDAIKQFFETVGVYAAELREAQDQSADEANADMLAKTTELDVEAAVGAVQMDNDGVVTLSSGEGSTIKLTQGVVELHPQKSETTKEEELLVVVPAASLPAAIRNAPDANISLLEIGDAVSLTSWTDSLVNEFGFIMPRTSAETDKRQRQLITYTVLVTLNESRTHDVLGYSRAKSGGEARLNDKLSIGIGGHVNKEDLNEAKASNRPLLTVATLRELEEELAINASKVDPDTFFEGVLAGEWDLSHAPGLICSSASDVDSVHLGLVRIIEVPSHIAPHISMQDNPSKWVDIAKLGDHFPKLESWSKICANTLRDLYV